MSTFKATILKGAIHTKMDGTTNVKIRITHKPQISYISTVLHIQPKDFDKSQGVAKSGTNKHFINLRIMQILHDYIKKDIELGDRRDYMIVKAIRDYLLSEKLYNNHIDFFEFTEELIVTVNNKGTQVENLNIVKVTISVEELLQYKHGYKGVLRVVYLGYQHPSLLKVPFPLFQYINC